LIRRIFNNIDKIIELTATDYLNLLFPQTYVVLCKSVITGLPEISLPIAIERSYLDLQMQVFSTTQSNAPFHGCYWDFNPDIRFTRITSTTRTDAIDIERAKSRKYW
jgi:hypothetical protein